jgi:type VI protein secretion system component Hcp
MNQTPSAADNGASHATPLEGVEEEIMSRAKIMMTDTGKAGQSTPLTDNDLAHVSGGATPKLYEFCAKGTHVQSGHDRWIQIESWHI